jgi:pyocin large subunit-like protein
LAVPFRDDDDLQQHFEDHRYEFPNVTLAATYLLLAERFLTGPKGPDTEECFRPQGGWARYDRVTQEYGSVRADGTIATYFRPDPAIHHLASNMDYFLMHCR